MTLNFWIFVLTSFGRPISLPLRSISSSKYSSGVILHGLPIWLYSSWNKNRVIYHEDLQRTALWNTLHMKKNYISLGIHFTLTGSIFVYTSLLLYLMTLYNLHRHSIELDDYEMRSMWKQPLPYISLLSNYLHEKL